MEGELKLAPICIHFILVEGVLWVWERPDRFVFDLDSLRVASHSSLQKNYIKSDNSFNPDTITNYNIWYNLKPDTCPPNLLSDTCCVVLYKNWYTNIPTPGKLDRGVCFEQTGQVSLLDFVK